MRGMQAVAAVVLLCLVVGLSQPAKALKCYVCSSVKSQRCTEPPDLDKSHLIECQFPAQLSNIEKFRPGCKKVVVKGHDGSRNITRGCLFARRGEDECQTQKDLAKLGNLGVVEYCSACDDDECNSAPAMFNFHFPTVITALLTSLLVCLTFK